ncbi:MAG: glycerol kinase GlpK [Candidatus Cardinium sp.]|nr:glycerol kinase GlpK [Candidatus Cardinium sp.]
MNQIKHMLHKNRKKGIVPLLFLATIMLTADCNEKLENKTGQEEMVLLGAIDQGTSSSRFLVFDSKNGSLIAGHQLEVQQQFPNPGFVEMCPEEIFETTVRCIESTCAELIRRGIDPKKTIKAIGITNQRETTIVWDRETGRHLSNAIVWSDCRTHELCDEYVQRTPTLDKNHFKAKTGLPIHPYFCALKLRWLLNNVSEVQQSLKNGNLMFGTVDTWLMWKLIGIHATDVTNASRTLLMDLRKRKWSSKMCAFFDIPKEILPEIRSSAEIYGNILDGPLKGIPLAGCLGDQQSSLIGHGCLQANEAKNTYGTGTFMLCNTGQRAFLSNNGLLTTIAYQFGQSSPVCYALEGSGSIGGNVVRFLRDNLQFFEKTADIEELAASVSNTKDVYFVPCFTGLYTPYWDSTARGIICGLTQSTTRAHIALAALKAVAFQTVEMVKAVEADMSDLGATVLSLRADGGMTQNALFNQIQADLLGLPLECSKMNEITAWGAALAAGIGAKLIDASTMNEMRRRIRPQNTMFYHPKMDDELRDRENGRWKEAIRKAFGWT